ncbi:methyltransferase [Lichenicoccus sp.]|uniref:methyltransferase n=1 Tax=Lichenicoccus sp. TaxID=2781899 RepID=UPI003D132ADA
MLDRWLSSPRFRRAATAFPLTRPIARRRASALFDLCAGFVYAQVLAACVELRLPQTLLATPGTAPALAPRLGLSEQATRRLLDASVALRLARRNHKGTYRLGALGAALIDNPGVAAMIAHHRMLYEDLRDPVALLRGETGTQLAEFWPYDAPSGGTGAYSALMAASQAMVADEVLASYRIRRHRCLLDVGGGDGSFLVAVAARAPTLRLVLFDLQPVCALAQARFATAGIARRARTVAGDFHRDRLPPGADLISLVRVLHDHDDDAALALLRAARTALAPGGRLLIAEPMAGTRGAAASGDAYFGFYLLAMGRGRPRRPEVIAAMLREAGFSRSRLLRTRVPLVTRVMIAVP